MATNSTREAIRCSGHKQYTCLQCSTQWLAVPWAQLVLLYMKGEKKSVCYHFLRLEEGATQQPNCPTPLLYSPTTTTSMILYIYYYIIGVLY